MWFYESVTGGLNIREIILNFMPSWWHGNYGIGYGEPMIFNPDYRMDAHRAMRRAFYDRYGRIIGAGTNDPKACVVLPDWDNTFYQAMLGFDVRYPIDQYPMAHGKLSDKEAIALQLPENLWDVFPYSELARQIRYMNGKLGVDFPMQMKTRGVLNEAVQICSTDFYGDLLDEDCGEKTRHVLGYVRDVIEQQLISNKRHNPSASHIMMNCTAGIVGAPVYVKRVYAYDRQLYHFCLQNRIPVGMHHCGRFDDFVDIYGSMDELYFVEIGHTSKIRPVVEKYPHAHIQYIVDTQFMRERTAPEIRAFAGEILGAVAGAQQRFTLSVPDLEVGTPDENILTLIEAFKR